MTGLVLCGGESSRMGTDKGLIEHETGSWAQVTFDKLKALQIPVFLSVNKKQYENYATKFPADKLIVDNEELQINGPLLGLLSAHLLFSNEDIFIPACDMPLMATSVLQQLQQVCLSDNQAQAFAFSNAGEAEPLCGIYKSAAIAAIHSLYKSRQLPKHSMKFMLEHVNTHSIALAEEQKQFFRNFNSHAELNGL